MQFLSASSKSFKHATFLELNEFANHVFLIDNHAHPFFESNPSSTQHTPLPRLEHILTEATSVQPNAPTMTARMTLAHSRSVRDMHQLFDRHIQSYHYNGTRVTNHSDEMVETSVEETRANLGLWPLAKLCFGAAKISAVFIDDGLYPPSHMSSVPYLDLQNKLPISIARRVLRLETEAEFALSVLISVDEFSLWQSPDTAQLEDLDPTYFACCFRSAFRSRISPLPADVVAFKTIAAYRSTLQINLERTDEELNTALKEVLFNKQKPLQAPEYRLRLNNRVIIDAVVKDGFDVARMYDIPIQVHCGFGDCDVDILNANPCLLRNVFHSYPSVAVVLLHAAWPYVREAAFLAGSYAKVYVDFGLAIPLLSIGGMVKVLEGLFEIAPHDKIMYSSDAHSTPDVFFLAALWGRKILAAVVTNSVLVGDLSVVEAKTAIKNILSGNAAKLYDVKALL